MDKEERTRRWNFVLCELIGTVHSIDLTVRRLDYEVLDDGTELAIITRTTGKQKIINITGNSLATIAIKVIRSL